MLATKFQRLYTHVLGGSRPNCPICIITGSYFLLKIQDGGLQTGNTIISACGWASNETLTVIPMFSPMSDSAVLYAMSQEVVFSWKSKIAAAKPEILLYQRSDELETKFQQLYPCFLGCPTQLFYRRNLFSAANLRWRPENRNSYHFWW